MSLYPIKDSTVETLTPVQLKHFNRMFDALLSRLALEQIEPELLDLGSFDGIDRPLPFPDLHWEIATCWMLIDGTLPGPIIINDGSIIEYTNILLRDASSLQRWRKKIEYARTGFRFR